MRIVHVSNFPTGIRPHPYSTVECALSNGLIRLGHLVINFNDRDVARAKSYFPHRKFGLRATNDALKELCLQIRPHLLLLGHAAMISSNVIASIRRELPNLRVAQWHGDFLGNEDVVEEIKKKQPVVDLTFVTTYASAEIDDLRRYGRVAFLPNPVDFSIEDGRADQLVSPAYDLLVDCGNPNDRRVICGQKWTMSEFVTKIASCCPQLTIKKLGGGQWGSHTVDASYHEIASCSAIGLNISVATNHLLYSSDRIVKLIGNGCLVAVERQTGLEHLFSDDEMLLFSSIDELLNKLSFYKKHPQTRCAHAKAGRAHYGRLFNEKRVASYMLQSMRASVTTPALPKDWQV